MPVKVIDASALAAIVFAEPEADRVVAQVRGYSLAAPALLPFEIASVCLKKVRRYPKKRPQLLAAIRMMEMMEISQTEVDLQEAVLLAEERQLTVYDAAYLWLARRLGSELVTLDEKLAKARGQV
ncbi:MAG TPA: type II toxin-antitoxin system VapC family toxin [Acidobacteriota bacterium]|jgi:predicted nucleic acid-binding protein